MISAPKKIKVLLIGPTGMLGSALAHRLLRSRFIQVFLSPSSKFNILKQRVSELNIKKYDWVINAAGFINRRIITKQDEDMAFKINSEFPMNLAEDCEKNKVKLIHQSTDCVFDGKVGLYNEFSKVNSKDIYGLSKIYGEPKNCLVLRSSLIGPETKNFYSLLSWFLRQKECDGFTRHLWNGITTVQASCLIEEIIIKNLYAKRVQHYFSNDISKYELLKILKNSFYTKTVIHKNEHPCKDMRLRTIYNDELACLKVKSIQAQIKILPKIVIKNHAFDL